MDKHRNLFSAAGWMVTLLDVDDGFYIIRESIGNVSQIVAGHPQQAPEQERKEKLIWCESGLGDMRCLFLRLIIRYSHGRGIKGHNFLSLSLLLLPFCPLTFFPAIEMLTYENDFNSISFSFNFSRLTALRIWRKEGATSMRRIWNDHFSASRTDSYLRGNQKQRIVQSWTLVSNELPFIWKIDTHTHKRSTTTTPTATHSVSPNFQFRREVTASIELKSSMNE